MKRIIDKIIELIRAVKAGDQAASKSVFVIMVGIIIISFIWAVMSETILKPKYERPQMAIGSATSETLSNSFSGVVSTTSDLLDIMEIKSSIDSLVRKDSLSPSDSVKLLNAFQHLEFLNRKNNPKHYEEN